LFVVRMQVTPDHVAPGDTVGVDVTIASGDTNAPVVPRSSIVLVVWVDDEPHYITAKMLRNRVSLHHDFGPFSSLVTSRQAHLSLKAPDQDGRHKLEAVLYLRVDDEGSQFQQVASALASFDVSGRSAAEVTSEKRRWERDRAYWERVELIRIERDQIRLERELMHRAQLRQQAAEQAHKRQLKAQAEKEHQEPVHRRQPQSDPNPPAEK